MGGWLTSGDLALGSCAQFLDVAEHRLIPSRARSAVTNSARLVITLFGLLLARIRLHWGWCCQSGFTPQFQEFFRLGRVLRTTLPTSRGGLVHLFVVYGYQGAEEDAEKLRLTDRLLQAVLAEAQVVCVGQPMLIAGDLNADPAVIPCLA